MKKKIICFSVCIMLLVTYAGALSTTDVKVKTSGKSSSNFDYSHTILGEFFTLQDATPSKYSHSALQYLYNSEYHPFYYISMVYDKNKWADQRSDELDVYVSPTVVWDGGYIKDLGSNEDIKADMVEYNESIIACGNRNVKDIDLNLDVEWLGAVNPIPPDGATDWWGDGLSFNISAMDINVTVVNNEDSQYDGHLHGYVTEINSTMWDDKWGNPYTFAFLDYAWNENISINPGDTWNDSIEWDGCDHNDRYGQNYFWIEQDNIMVIASIFDKDNNNYSDETTGFIAGIGTTPKRFDLYFGNTTPPPLILENMSTLKWIPDDELNWNETYYWRIDVRDAKGNVKFGDIWSFTTRDNNPPYEPSDPNPIGPNATICGNLSWNGGDPDGDDVIYDVYFGNHPENNMQQVSWNQTEEWFCLEDIGFNKTYYWKIVAWEVDYDLFTVGPIWSFTTEVNLPPNLPEDPHPPDGDPCVPTEGGVLCWNGSDPNLCDTLLYDLYFDDVNPPLTQVLSGYYENCYEIPFTLSKYKTYYWRVDTYDKMDEFAEGYVWSFSTGDIYPPTDPIIDGPLIGGINKEYEFTFVSTFPYNQSIWYRVRWDDGTENITGLYPSGEVVTLSHSWNTYGLKNILAKAYGENGQCSDWSSFQFTVTRNKIFNLNLFELLFGRFTNTIPTLRQLIYM